MKKNCLVFMMFASSLVPMANAQVSIFNQPQVQIIDPELEINEVRDVLRSNGYSVKMMNHLFGAENHFFPSTTEKLEQSIFMVNHLIENGTYEQKDRDVMIFILFEAHNLFNGKNQLAKDIATVQ